MTRVALVTWRGLPYLSADDRLLRDELGRRGIEVDAAVWDDAAVQWAAYHSVVVRSTWDYHKRTAEFRAWLDRMERHDAALWNPARLLRWNIHKSYLLRLESAGVPIVPTVTLPDSSSVRDVMRERGWSRAVVKPATSATAFHTSVVSDADDQPLELLADVLVQPFMEEIVREGEWSLVFFDGAFSHSVCKRPREGDFRVQSDWGGSASVENAEQSLVDQAGAVLAAIEQEWLYARVDGVVRDGKLLLMELEMTEPALFLASADTAPVRFADAIVRRLR